MTEPDKAKASGKWRTRFLAAVGGITAALLSLGYSVSKQNATDTVPKVGVSTLIDAGRWNVSILKAISGPDLPTGLSVSPGLKAIVVEMLLENISSESSNLYGDLVMLSNFPDTQKPHYYLLRDRSILWDLQPRMPEAVAAVWEVPADLELPPVLEVRVQGVQFKPRDNLYAAPGWFPHGDVAQVSLPLSASEPGNAR